MKRIKRWLKTAGFPIGMSVAAFVLFIYLYIQFTRYALVPQYLKSLVFALPFLIYALIAFFMLRGKLRNGGAGSLICLAMLFTLGWTVFWLFDLGMDETTARVTDASDYERILELVGYPEAEDFAFFPAEIDADARDAHFFYRPPFLQGGEEMCLSYRADAQSILSAEAQYAKAAIWSGDIQLAQKERGEAFIYNFLGTAYEKMLPEDFTIYVLTAQAYKPEDWNHGQTRIVAISRERNEIIYESQNW